MHCQKYKKMTQQMQTQQMLIFKRFHSLQIIFNVKG